ncbi:hypothetical protein ACIPDS_03610 [Kluyvera sp. NPDC087067]|uniref:hypothetical protein n=1 Tax=unclassified Kluyvera TaxID=2619995 RepID=UPI0037F80FFD
MKLDTQITIPVIGLVVLSALLPLAADWQIPLLGGAVVTQIENVQALWLLFGALFTAWYIKPYSRPKGEKQFWMWAVMWWIVLLGRSTSWGRAYFPEVPHIVFRIISVILVGGLLLSLLSSSLRKEIARRMKENSIPVWLLAVTVLTFLISDTVEHHRLLAPLFVRDVHYADLMEELYEVPFLIGLFLTTFYFMRADKMAKKVYSSATQYLHGH